MRVEMKDRWGNMSESVLQAGSPRVDIFKEPSYVETIDNHIYLYGTIESSVILQFNRRLREIDNELLAIAYRQEREPASIIIHISSYGGSLLQGLAGMDAILQMKCPTVTVVDGCCASAATFLSVVGKKRKMGSYSFMMIHQLSALTWGKYRELLDDQKNFDRFMKTIKEVYLRYTKVPEQKIDEILDHDLWFDSGDCLEYGLVDEVVIGGEKSK